MKLSRLVLALMLVVSGSAIYSQDSKGDFKKTESTAFPISMDKGWYWFADTNDCIYFMSINNMNLKEKVNPIWVREYNYKANTVIQALQTVNRLNTTSKITETIKYNLTTGSSIKSNYDNNDTFSPIGPDTISDALLKALNEFEEIENKYSKTKKKPK